MSSCKSFVDLEMKFFIMENYWGNVGKQFRDVFGESHQIKSFMKH